MPGDPPPALAPVQMSKRDVAHNGDSQKRPRTVRAFLKSNANMISLG